MGMAAAAEDGPKYSELFMGMSLMPAITGSIYAILPVTEWESCPAGSARLAQACVPLTCRQTPATRVLPPENPALFQLSYVPFILSAIGVLMTRRTRSKAVAATTCVLATAAFFIYFSGMSWHENQCEDAGAVLMELMCVSMPCEFAERTIRTTPSGDSNPVYLMVGMTYMMLVYAAVAHALDR